jgi:hypothetical protein
LATVSGGKKFEAAVTNLVSKLNKPGSVKIGFLRGATYPDGQSVAEVAFFNDRGTKTAPPRPFFRNMIAAKQREWPAAMAGLLKTTNYDVARTMELTGEAVKGQLQQSIKDTNSPPLAQSTIDRKGFSKPLIETSVMINSVDKEVKT